jgi:uncharacterized protein YecT (DUF1311 family)
MRQLITALPLLALITALGTAPVVCAQEELRTREECSTESQASMRECLQKKADASDADLGEVEQLVRATIAKWNEDPKYIEQARARLDAANRQFTAYRDAHCAFNASLSGNAAGNAREIRRLACVHEINLKRIQQLKAALTELPAK